MDKLLAFFGTSWVKYTLIVVAIAAYTSMIFYVGKRYEQVNTLKLENEYKTKEIAAKNEQVINIQNNITAFQDAVRLLKEQKDKTSVITKQLHTETIKEVEKPIYKECQVGKEYFDSVNDKINKLNEK